MLEKTREKPLSKRERLFCELRYKDEVNDEEIAQRVGIAPSTIYVWIKRLEIIAEIERLGKVDTERAVRFFRRGSLRAAKATMKLTETRLATDEKGKPVLDGKGRQLQDFVQPGEVVRKASADILQAVEVPIKGPQETGDTASVVVYLPDNKRRGFSDPEPKSKKKKNKGQR